MKLDQAVRAAQKENEELTARVDEIARHALEIKTLKEKQPEWLYALELFRKAVPKQVDDDKFLTYLASELQRNNVKFLGVDVSPGGQWLGKLRDADKKQLEGIGVDINAASEMRVSFYSVRVLGEYDDVLTSLENLKRYGRLYTIDQITSPAAGAPGTVLAATDTAVPIEVSGKMYFGIPENYINSDQLIEDIIKNLVGANAVSIKNHLTQRGKKLVGGPGSAEDERFGNQKEDAAGKDPGQSKKPADTETQTSWGGSQTLPASLPAQAGSELGLAGS
jgi:hypothetical protein